MHVVVIEPPENVVSLEEARRARAFTEGDDDEYVEELLEIAQSEIDGPGGWLGRSIGMQTLKATIVAGDEFFADVRADRLPYQPVTEILRNELSADGCQRVVEYRAGQGFDDVPRRLKRAIILMAAALKDAAPDEGGFIKRKTVEGVGSREYTLPNGAADKMKAAADSLLFSYWKIG